MTEQKSGWILHMYTGAYLQDIEKIDMWVSTVNNKWKQGL